MGVVYHGSPYGGLKVIKRNVSTHRKSCVYATDNEVVAYLFLARGNEDLDTVIGINDKEVLIVERREGVFNNLYNKSGYMYELDDKNFSHYDYLWSSEMISFEDEKVISEKKIENVLDKLYELRNNGKLKMYIYPNRPFDIPLDNSDLIDKYINAEKKGVVGAIDHMLHVYPEFKNEVEKRLKEEII